MIRYLTGALAAVALTILIAGCGGEPSGPPKAPEAGTTSKAGPLLVHVGGTMRPAMEEICKLYEQESGQKVEVNYGDSGELMIKLQQTGKGDVLVVHDPFAAKMEKDGFVDRSCTVAVVTPVIAVKKGNPKKIAGLKDLTRDDVKVGLTDAEYSTTGHIVDVMFKKAGIAGAMAKKEIPRTRGGGGMANNVKLGTVDAAIVWNAVVFERRDALDAVDIEPAFRPDPKLDAVTSATYGPIDMSCAKVVLMTMKKAGNLEAARKLADLAVSERGRAIWARNGFSPAPGAAPEPKGQDPAGRRL
jgi:molybdate transport system substrate-binding protein